MRQCEVINRIKQNKKTLISVLAEFWTTFTKVFFLVRRLGTCFASTQFLNFDNIFPFSPILSLKLFDNS